jgi:2-hydroxychromene-2-carboxylate isomerase
MATLADSLPPLSSPLLRRRPGGPSVRFYFDVACPFSYLAAERVERTFGTATWIPAASVAMYQGERWAACDPAVRAQARRQAEARATELRLPLVWPEEFPVHAPMALRAASYAAEVGAGAAFALAAGRLAYCGGFDLEAPDVIAEAAAAAGIRLDACLAAAADEARDGRLDATGRWLLSLGVPELPAISVGGRWFGGEPALAGAMAAALAG